MRAFRLFTIVFLTGVLAVLGLPEVGAPNVVSQIYGIGDASAQEARRKKRRGLFSILFGRKKAKRKAVSKRSRRRQRSSRKRNRNRTNSAAANGLSGKKPVVEKAEGAKVILVVGDFFGSGLADGLVKSLSDVASLRVVNKSKGLSGFVRNDIIDWPTQLQPLVEEVKPSYIVAMLGSNDRQLIREDGKRFKKRTPEWNAAYTKRVMALGTALKATGIAYTWVGLPPVRFKSMNKDFLLFNEIYGKAATSPKGKFVDVWDGFSDAEGNYSRSGPDVNGQIVLLRSKGGINLTRAGKQRLAYYVEGQILKTLGGRDKVALGNIGIDFDTVLPKAVGYDPAKTGRTIVVRLDDPSADGGEALAGETVDLANSTAKNLKIPLAAGAAVTARRQGRVDNFTWPPVEAAAPAAKQAVAATN